MIRKLLSLVLAGMMMLSICSCDQAVKPTPDPTPTQGPTESKEPVDVSDSNIMEKSAIMTDQLYEDGKNIMISPLSLYTALGMVMNGADGETKKELESFVGMDTEALNKLVENLMSAKAPEWAGDNWPTVKMANGIWMRNEEAYKLSSSFEDVIHNSYKGEVKLSAMDQSTVNEINDFAKKNTNDMIPSILNEIDPATVAILVNALYFEAVWGEVYEDYQVFDEKFHGTDGDVDIKLMSSVEGTYFENDKAVGFSKSYIGPYEFIGILPKEEGDFDIADLDINSLLESRSNDYDVDAYLPKFEFDWGSSLMEMMKNLGVTKSFDGRYAEFRKMFNDLPDNENVFISNIIQKTKIELFETGTKAAAVTAITMDTCSAAIPEEKERKEVRLDRPFAFIILDRENDIPLFIGKLVNP